MTIKRGLAAVLAAVLALSVTGCEEEPAGGNTNVPGAADTGAATQGSTTRDENDFADTDAEIKEVSSSDFVPDGNSGKITWLGYYSLEEDGSSAEQYKIFTSETYGGEIEYISCASGSAYFEKLGALIASDDSPDIVRYEWMSFPNGMSKNMYEPLDEYIDPNTALWKDMAAAIEDFAYKGKHYYYPYRITTNFAINYNRAMIDEYSLTDPYDLYLENNWTWDTFRQLLVDWCNIDEDKIGYAGEGGMSFIATTGTSLVDVKSDGTIMNNINDPNVSRAMQFVSDLYRDGLTYQGELGDWVSPQTWAKNSDRLLFLGMNPEWTYSAASAEIQNPQGVENDIIGVPSDFAFVPFPRDPNSESYNIAYDTFGYMVAKGAPNIKGAVDWINLNRVYQTDENLIASAREDAINPKPITFTSGKYEGYQKWQLVWDERVYDLWQDMLDPKKFNFSFDDCRGFTDEMNTICDTILFDPMFHGESWTQLSGEYAGSIDYIISEYTTN